MCNIQKAAICVSGLIAGLIGWTSSVSAQMLDQRDLTVVQKPIYEFGVPHGSSRVDVDAWLDNPSLTYAIGQPLRIMVRPHRDAYITVIDVGSSGRVTVLYPNFYQRDTRVSAGATVMIPGDRVGWRINVSGPPGVDLIKVIASRRPLVLPELNELVRSSDASPFLTLGRSAELVLRDLVPQLDPQTTGSFDGVRNLLVRVVPSYAVGQIGLGAVPGLPIVSMQPAGFGLTIRPHRPVYRVGEPVRIVASTENDCRLTLISIGPSGDAVQLFPNPVQPDNLIRAGQVISVPPVDSPLKVVARPPTGIEGVIGICRDQTAAVPLPDAAGQTGFVTLGTIQTVSRDLIASAADAPRTEQASTSYLVVE